MSPRCSRPRARPCTIEDGYTNVYPLDTLLTMALKTKNAGLRLRVERDLRDEFVDVCRADGRAAAEVLRDFMRTYVAQNRAAAQEDMFDGSAEMAKQ